MRFPQIRLSLHEEDHLKALIGWSLLSAFYILVALLVRELDHRLPLILLGFSLVIVVIYTLIMEFTPARGSISKFGARYKAWGIILLGIWLVMLTVVFGLFMGEFDAAYGSGFSVHGNADTLSWLGFAFDNLLEALLFDVVNIYHLSLSGITASSPVTETMVLMFRLYVDLLVIKFIVNYLKVVRGQGILSSSMLRSMPIVSRFRRD